MKGFMYINIAVEDPLSEAILREIVQHSPCFKVHHCYNRGGNGYIKKTIRGSVNYFV